MIKCKPIFFKSARYLINDVMILQARVERGFAVKSLFVDKRRCLLRISQIKEFHRSVLVTDLPLVLSV